MEDDDIVHLRVQSRDPELMSDHTESEAKDGESEVVLSQTCERGGEVSQNNNAMCVQNSSKVSGRNSSVKCSKKRASVSHDMDNLLKENVQPSTSNDNAQSNTSNGTEMISTQLQSQIVNRTIEMTMKQLMEQGRLRMEDEVLEQPRQKFNRNSLSKGNNVANVTKDFQSMGSQSEVTIYDNAVKDGVNKCTSSSSDEANDTIDENIEQLNVLQANVFADSVVDQRININPLSFPERDAMMQSEDEAAAMNIGIQEQNDRTRVVTAEDRSAQLIKEAELSKARVLELPSKNLTEVNANKLSSELLHSVAVDENYHAVMSHVDPLTRQKIEKGEYMDFAKLLPRDRIMIEDDEKIHLVVKDGRIFPMSKDQHDSTVVIDTLHKWEQAFRVFSDIYTRAYPMRAAELIQYDHVIHSAAQAYCWNSVYLYDKDFRIHMMRYPGRTWGIILQQAWNLRLKERNKFSHDNRGAFDNRNVRTSLRETCKRFNKGKCSNGIRCHYEHKCLYCHKLGHGMHICRKAQSDRSERLNLNEESTNSTIGKLENSPGQKMVDFRKFKNK